MEPKKANRSIAVDVARGLAIIGVVFNHAVDGLSGAGLVVPGQPVVEVNDALYIARMPTLVLLVGLFIPSGVAKHGKRGYLRRRVTLLVYIYVIWQVLEGSVELSSNSLRNGSTDGKDILALWSPIAHLWFLPFLTLATVAVVLLRPWRDRRTQWLTAVALTTVSLCSWGWGVNWFGLQGTALLSFLALGSCIGLGPMARWLDGPVLRVVTVGGAALLCFLIVHRAGLVPATVRSSAAVDVRAASLVAAVLGVTTLLAVSALLARVPRVNSVLAAVGRTTLPIYLAHVMVVAGGRVVLVELGWTSATMLVVLVPLGVIVPALVWHMRATLHARWLFDVPRPVARLLQDPRLSRR